MTRMCVLSVAKALPTTRHVYSLCMAEREVCKAKSFVIEHVFDATLDCNEDKSLRELAQFFEINDFESQFAEDLNQYLRP